MNYQTKFRLKVIAIVLFFIAIVLGLVWASITTHSQEVIEIYYKEVTFDVDEDGIVSNSYYVYTPNESIYEVNSRTNYNKLLVSNSYLVSINYLNQIHKVQKYGKESRKINQ